MTPSLRRTGAALGVAGALAVAAIGCGGSTDGTASATQPGSQQQTQPAGAPGQGQGGADLSALATKLGVSESKLQAAMEATRPSGGGQPPQSGQTQGQTS